ncbi:hypothetical protein H7F15_12035 [Pontibacter sp. Tf4]|uniref:sensor histidine kinase n=1 Tax=Pontibacter sp. Tf4 TaxID=2761620 RepID=UPI00162A1795|nr:ATP-binding protein [Pontibacter sp. Tf4]MBB6611771.1 hypothetical protein [Pontibacter sp. Tf4]
MPDVVLIVAVGTALLLLLGMFITFMTLTYQKKRLLHQQEVTELVDSYQKEMLKAQLEMQEQTFLSISQEIHDNVGQVLSLARLNISTLENTITQAGASKLATSKELIDQAIQDLRDLSKRLNSKYVTQQPLSALLKFQLELIGKTGVIDTSFDLIGQELPVAPDKKLILFRIAQEAINNILRHAQADAIAVRVSFRADGMTLNISDNGRGFDQADPAPALLHMAGGTGITNMHSRAAMIGAKFSIESTPGAGTLVHLELPIRFI